MMLIKEKIISLISLVDVLLLFCGLHSLCVILVKTTTPKCLSTL